MTMKCILRPAVIIFLALSEEIAFGMAGCSSRSPKDPAKYNSYVETVLGFLVDKTPANSMETFRSWYPDQNTGSASGFATCYTADQAACKACLQSVKTQLDQCTKSTAGGYSGSKCIMQFWQIGSI